ncbi:MAG TPA: hypothetical protein VIH09_07705, partial [Flavobacterium sp.]|uniref:hypothetical protein n=1 Tax=Flavobacterium sp. TaxID=239 RepID=UPI002F3F14BA
MNAPLVLFHSLVLGSYAVRPERRRGAPKSKGDMIPKYLEEIQAHLSAEENIKNLCFERSGLLFNEFNQIFTDIFSSRSETYK